MTPLPQTTTAAAGSPTSALTDPRLPWLAAVVAASFALRFAAAIAFPNIHRPDEILQNLEPAFTMLHGGGVVSWEWREGLRSPIFPGFLAGLIFVAERFGLGPAGYLAVVSAVLSLVASATAGIGFLLGWRQARLAGGLVCGALCVMWPDLVYFGPKTMTEVQAGNLLVVAAYLAMAPYGARPGRRMAAAGLLLGLVFCVRFQLAPAIAVTALWAGRLAFRRRWLPMAVAGLAVLLAMGLIDLAVWGSFLHSVVQNWRANVTDDVASAFGVQPPYWYLARYVSDWGAAIVPIALAALLGLRRAPLMGAIAAAVVLPHSLTAHKEISFTYAALPPVFVLAGLGTAEAVVFFRRHWPGTGAPAIALAAIAFWAATSLTTALDAGLRPQWYENADILALEAMIRTDPELCGLAIRYADKRWYWTGGDVHLGRPIPISVFNSAAALPRAARAANYVAANRTLLQTLPGFTILRCWDGGALCVAHAQPDTGCIPDPALDLNTILSGSRKGGGFE